MSFRIAKWVSTQVYSLSNYKDIAYIFNHKSNEFIELEGISALLWKALINHSTEKELIDFSKKNKIEAELEDFLNELSSLGLITNPENKNRIFSPYFNNSLKNIEELIDFQAETTEFLGKNGFLPRLFLEMTYNCNLKCLHCFNEKHQKPSYITFEEIKPLIDEAEKLGTFYIALSGGECTLNPDFIRILEYIREKKLAFDFFTNGQTLYDNNEFFQKVIDLYPFKISLSLYSMNPETHDKITCVKGSHYKTLNVIKKLQANNINVEIKCFLTKYNAYDYKDIQMFAKEHNISLTIDYELLSNPDNSNNDVRITEKQLLDLLLDEQSLYNIKNIKPHNINDDFKNLRICGAGHNCLLINPNLEIYVCPPLKISLGNYRNTSLKNIWLNKDANSELNKLKALKKTDLKSCYKQEQCKYCIYCPAISHSANHHLKPYKYFCKESKVKLKAAKLAGIYND